MIYYPIAKINLGLNVVGKRSDGYHNLETVFYPVQIKDALEVYPMDEGFPSAVDCDLKVTNANFDCNEQQNLVVRAYRQLATIYALPRVHAHLFKAIPSQAGLGGGSSDCAYMIMALAKLFELPMTETEMIYHASKLGADCAFFIKGTPCYAEGIGEQLTPISLSLKGYHLVLVHPNIPVSTREAFSLIEPRPTVRKCREIVSQPIGTWRDQLTNDFEKSVFALHPEIGEIKEELYRRGADYAAMSGSGSSVFGIFKEETDLRQVFEGMEVMQVAL